MASETFLKNFARTVVIAAPEKEGVEMLTPAPPGGFMLPISLPLQFSPEVGKALNAVAHHLATYPSQRLRDGALRFNGPLGVSVMPRFIPDDANATGPSTGRVVLDLHIHGLDKWVQGVSEFPSDFPQHFPEPATDSSDRP